MQSSKKKAAELMLEELRKLPPASNPIPARAKRKPAPKKKSRNLVKEQATPEYGQGINPISRLIQIQQSKKEKEPVYTLIAERGVPRRREFVMQVVVGSVTAEGIGPNKKLAKRAAAENVLQMLGYTKPSPQPIKSAIKGADSAESDKTRKVTFHEACKSDSSASNSVSANAVTVSSNMSGGTVTGSRQLAPGLIVLGGAKATNASGVSIKASSAIAKELLGSSPAPTPPSVSAPQPAVSQIPASSQSAADTSLAKASSEVASETTKSDSVVAGTVPVNGNQSSSDATTTASSAQSSSTSGTSASSTTTSTPGVRAYDQLIYLAQILGLQFMFTDFPRVRKMLLRLYILLV